MAAGRCGGMSDVVTPLPLPPRTARAPFRQALVVCGKCARKLGGGFGPKGRGPLRKELKRALKRGGWGRDVRVLEASCLGLCPKRRQVVAGGAQLAAGRLLVVEPGADAAEVLDRLLERASPQG